MATIFFHLSISSLQLVFLVLLFGWCTHLEFLQSASCLTDVKTTRGCIDIEREALLKFKSDLTDPSNRLSSWHAWDDCCVWEGVGCNDSTGHVVKLNLRNQVDPYDDWDRYENTELRGKVNPSLVHLKHLNYLDLSMNNFNTSNILAFIGSLSELKYLNLSWSYFHGNIPTHLGNLSKLQYLDLSVNHFNTSTIPAFIGSLSELKYLNLASCDFHGNIPTHLGNLSKLQYLDLEANDLKVDYNLEFLSGLSSLKYLSLTSVDLSKLSGDWLEHVNMLPSLIELRLSECSLQQIPLSLSSLNFTSLEYLDLAYNDFNSSMPRWLFNLTSLKTLDLSSSGIHGPIPDSFGNMTSLQIMYLFGNKLEGWIPRSMGTLCNLRNLRLLNNNLNGPIIELVDSLSRCSTSKLEMLDLSENKFNGTIPESLGNLTELVYLSLDRNFWEGSVSEAHFSNLTKLETFSLETNYNPLVLNISSNWACPFQLSVIFIFNCTIGPRFPSWIRTQTNLSTLTLSMVGISDVIPNWFTYSFPHLVDLDLSHNQIKGRVPLEFRNDFNAYKKANNSNRLQPLWQSKIQSLNFRSNLFSGSIPLDIAEIMPQLYYFDVSKNMITGGIPWALCKLTHLGTLILSSNGFTGELPAGPECWNNFTAPDVVDLSNNNLSGEIPNYFGFLQLNSLKLSNNNFSGKLPSPLRNCTSLEFLDLGENHFTGELPIFMGYQKLKVLRLRSNMLVGNIPQELCALSSLQLLDLSNNKLYGSIPSCLYNLSSMATFSSKTSLTKMGSFESSYDGRLIIGGVVDVSVIVLKGIELEYGKNLDLVRFIDLSSNKMSREIPNELTKLLALGLLNLSMNHFTGMIPENIGNLKQLELLDLSRNQLAGPIPPSMSTMTFLNHLNLSTNNLSGRIPTGFQLQTFNDPSIYGGNPQLCGPPLANNCSEKRNSPISIDDNGKEDEYALLWLYISIGVGFAVGLWGFCGTLVFNKSWRVTYFSFLENIIDMIYVFIAVRIARWQRMG